MTGAEKVSLLADSFPSLRTAPGVAPWDEERFCAWLFSGVSHGELCAGRFVLSVWKGFSLVAVLLLGCSGAPFESGRSGVTAVAGAPSGAGSISDSGSSGLSMGGAAAGGGAGGAESGGTPSIGLPCDVSAWKASAFASRLEPPEPSALAIDGNAVTRWSSGQARAAGQWFALELVAGVVLEQLELASPASPGDVPSSLVLELDGKPVAAAASSVGDSLRLTFKPTPASSLRLVLDAGADSWWSIAELGGICR